MTPSSLPSSLAGSYELLDDCILGRGSYAVVCGVRERATQQIQALKVMARRPLELRGLEEQAYREMTLQQDLRHTHILKIFHAVEADDHFYMLTEYAPCGSLLNLVAMNGRTGENGRMSELDASLYLSQVAAAVSYLHSEEIRILHRDLKAGNVLLVTPDLAKIADFGWSINFSDKWIPSGPAGTTSHMAPEVVDGLPHGTGADCWALGVLLYEIVVGMLPFTDVWDVRRVQYQAPDFLTPQARNLMAQLLRRDPASRLRATEVMRHPFITEQRVSSPVPTLLASPMASPRQRPPERRRTNVARRATSVGSLPVAAPFPFLGQPAVQAQPTSGSYLPVHIAQPSSGVTTPAIPAPTVLVQTARAVHARPMQTPRTPRRPGGEARSPGIMIATPECSATRPTRSLTGTSPHSELHASSPLIATTSSCCSAVAPPHGAVAPPRVVQLPQPAQRVVSRTAASGSSGATDGVPRLQHTVNCVATGTAATTTASVQSAVIGRRVVGQLVAAATLAASGAAHTAGQPAQVALRQPVSAPQGMPQR